MTMSKTVRIRVATALLVAALLTLSAASQVFPNSAWFAGVAHAEECGGGTCG